MELSPNVAATLEQAFVVLDQFGPDAVIATLRQRDPREAGDVYAALQKDLYWKRKNLSATVLISQAGIEFALSHARPSADAELASVLKMNAKRLAFNLASFTWPGWNQPGIAPTAADLDAGLRAAELNVSLAEELHRPPTDQANALWTLGAQQLAVSQFAGAVHSFEKAFGLAKQGSDLAQQAMLETYITLARMLAEPTNAGALEKLDQQIAALRTQGSQDAVFFAEQLLTAREVFLPRARV